MSSQALTQGGTVSDRPALARCISISADEFAGSVWGQKPQLSPAATLAGDFSDLFSRDAADEVVSVRGLRSPFLRMAKAGKVLPRELFTGPAGAGAGINDQALDDRVLAEYADGATLVLQALHRTWEPLRHFADQLVRDLGHPVQINAYITPPGSQGFSAHYDTHDVFVLQIAGTKQWAIHEPVIDHPLPSQAWEQRKAAVAEAAERAPYLTPQMTPGDALYLPRGWLHSATAGEAASIHLTIGIHTLSRYSIVESLLAKAATAPELRTNLPLGLDVSDPEAIGPEFDATIKNLVEWLESARSSSVTADLARSFDKSTRPEPIAPLRQAEAVAAISGELQIRARLGLRLSVSETADGKIKLHYGQRWLVFPEACSQALELLISGATVAVADLPGLDGDDQITVARRLLRDAVAVAEN